MSSTEPTGWTTEDGGNRRKRKRRKPETEKRKKLKADSVQLEGIRTVIFDLDGTLYDKKGLARRLVRRLWWCLPILAAERMTRRKMHNVHFASEEEFFAQFFAEMSRGHCWSAEKASKWYHQVYLPNMVELIGKTCPRRENVVALLNEAKKRGLKTAVYSDYPSVVDKLNVLGIDPKQFDLLVAAPELGALKPSKPCAEKVMKMLDADPRTTLFVGDRDEKDGETARIVGAKFLLI